MYRAMNESKPSQAIILVSQQSNGEYLASGSLDCTIGVWSVSSEEHIKTLYGHSSSVISVVFSPNEEYLASASRDYTIGVWKFFN